MRSQHNHGRQNGSWGRREHGGKRERWQWTVFFSGDVSADSVYEKIPIDFKDVGLLRNFLTERGRIVPRRISGNCMPHQRELTVAIKRARTIAILAFAEER